MKENNHTSEQGTRAEAARRKMIQRQDSAEKEDAVRPMQPQPRYERRLLDFIMKSILDIVGDEVPEIKRVRSWFVFSREEELRTGYDGQCQMPERRIGISETILGPDADCSYTVAVCIHELCHIIHGGHGADFWETNKRVMDIFNKKTGFNFRTDGG